MTDLDEYAGVADPYKVARSVSRPASHILIDGRVAADLQQCVHCGGHFMVMPGSGVQRGWCSRCSGPLCGHPPCFVCTPWQKQMEEIERRASREYRLGL